MKWTAPRRSRVRRAESETSALADRGPDVCPILVSALFVQARGCYRGVPGVDLWDIKRDARKYAGPYPVVAHPPCERWCRLAGLVESRWGHKRGEDGGCFASALESVRRFGGVLEHPAYSDAWPAFDLPTPSKEGGWQRGLFCGGWSCYVEQSKYGHPAKKATFLYAYGTALPDLRWGYTHDGDFEGMISWCGNHTKQKARGTRRRLHYREANATPHAFRDALLEIATSAVAR